ncbi:hypothetical protein D0A34_09095 [Microcoleus vaginatus PCC 9802]|nr:hypothetical protein D0A34_09095 [Microcoleus vaginatus PCC 9802]
MIDTYVMVYLKLWKHSSLPYFELGMESKIVANMSGIIHQLSFRNNILGSVGFVKPTATVYLKFLAFFRRYKVC